MPIVPSQFAPPAFLRDGHVQTVLPVLLRRRLELRFERERLDLDDGDFLDLDWTRGSAQRLAVLSHGLEGSSAQAYIRGLAATLRASGWDVLAWNFRGCSGEANRLLRFYHSGETGDLAKVVAHAAQGYTQLAVVGFSLGGNVTLKYLGEAPPHPAIVAAAAISVPIDLASCAQALDQKWSNRIYLRRFLATMLAKIEAKARLFPAEINMVRPRAIRGFCDFDDCYTAPIHGFRDAADYWEQSSARQFLPGITVPTLLLNAQNDPFLTPSCFPWSEAEANLRLFLEAPASGGHVGFLDLKHAAQPWWERRVVEFLAWASAAFSS